MIKKWNAGEKEVYEKLSEDVKKYFLSEGEEFLPIGKIVNTSEEINSYENWGITGKSVAIIDHNCIHKKIRAKCPKFLKAN